VCRKVDDYKIYILYFIIFYFRVRGERIKKKNGQKPSKKLILRFYETFDDFLLMMLPPFARQK